MIDDHLRRRSVGYPAARSLLLTITGEFVQTREEGVWHETLVTALTTIGYTEQAARQALSRSVRDGWLRSERHGRRTRLSLTARSLTLLSDGAARIYSFGEPWVWDERWLLVVLRVPETRRAVRHQLRTQLAWAGLGSIGGGIWVTPHAEREHELSAIINAEPDADARSFVASLGELGDPHDLVSEAWDLNQVQTGYREFIEDFQDQQPASPEACFMQQTLLVHAWRRFPFLDPDLPTSLLPSDWPRAAAHALFTERHGLWAAGASEYFEGIEARFGAYLRR